MVGSMMLVMLVMFGLEELAGGWIDKPKKCVYMCDSRTALVSRRE